MYLKFISFNFEMISFQNCNSRHVEIETLFRTEQLFLSISEFIYCCRYRFLAYIVINSIYQIIKIFMETNLLIIKNLTSFVEIFSGIVSFITLNMLMWCVQTCATCTQNGHMLHDLPSKLKKAGGFVLPEWA